jgi:hypothetical protein
MYLVHLQTNICSPLPFSIQFSQQPPAEPAGPDHHRQRRCEPLFFWRRKEDSQPQPGHGPTQGVGVGSVGNVASKTAAVAETAQEKSVVQEKLGKEWQVQFREMLLDMVFFRQFTLITR